MIVGYSNESEALTNASVHDEIFSITRRNHFTENFIFKDAEILEK